MKIKIKKPIPFAFVLDELDSLPIRIRPMFGCTAVYMEDRLIFILREREEHSADNGIWLATSVEHHDSLRKLFPRMKDLALFETEGPTSWQNLPCSDPQFEEWALKACKLIKRGDPRIGKIPAKKKKIKKN